jgi:hypothetical protein
VLQGAHKLSLTSWLFYLLLHVSGTFGWSLESWCCKVSFIKHTTLICKVTHSQKCKYSRVLFCNGLFYKDSYTTLVQSDRAPPTCVHHCHNSSILSLRSALLALSGVHVFLLFLFECSSLELIVIFPPMMSIKKTEKKRKSKQLTLQSLLMSSEPWPGPSSTKKKWFDW